MGGRALWNRPLDIRVVGGAQGRTKPRPLLELAPVRADMVWGYRVGSDRRMLRIRPGKKARWVPV